MEDIDTIAKRHFMLAENFLQLVENILIEIVENGDTDIFIGPPKTDIQEYFRQTTKWSSFRILVPTLFNFFHGIELLMKAANYKVTPPSQRPNH